MALFHSRAQAANARLQRRVFLSALAAGVAAPLAYRFSVQATAAPAGRVPRLFVFFVPHGVPIEHSAVPANFDLTASGVGVWSSLTPYKDHLIIPQGIGNYVETNHTAIHSTLSGEQDSGSSIDYVIAEKLGLTAHVLGVQSHRMQGTPSDSDSRLFYRGGLPATPHLNPADGWDAIFGSSSDQAEFAAHQAALDVTESQLEKMRNALGVECSDASGLSEHLNALSEIKATDSCAQLSDVSTALSLRESDPHDQSLFGKLLRGHLEVAAQGLICGAARVVGLQNLYVNAQLRMNFSGGPGYDDYHHDPLSHSIFEAGRESFANCQKWFVDQLVTELVARLDQPDPLDASHTVLENTTILFVTEVIDGAAHITEPGEMWVVSQAQMMNAYMPWFILGGGAGNLKTGQIVSYANRDHRDLLATIAAAMGVSLTNVGGRDVQLLSEILA